MQQNKVLATEYQDFMQTLFNIDHAEFIPSTEESGSPGCIWYLPHHGVYGSRYRSKLRIVFDASAQFNGTSLNDCLLGGPDLINNLVGVLLRFRQKSIAIKCDVKKMFHQFYVNEENRDQLRFLWWKDGNVNDEVVDCCMRVHVFGAKSSLSCANFSFKQNALDNQNNFPPSTVSFMFRSVYVDDGLKSVPTEDEARDFIESSKAICSQAGFTLHKFVSNSPVEMQGMNATERASGVRDLNLQPQEEPCEKTLGIGWNVDADTFQFKINLRSKPDDRRGILSQISSVFDPLGLVAPVLLGEKQILQALCLHELDWERICRIATRDTGET